MLLTTISATANILGNPAEPHKISKTDSQLLYGEQFMVEEPHGLYVYGHSVLDGYKGYVDREQLAKEQPEANMIVNIRSTHLYPEPDFRSRPDISLSFLSRVTATEETGNGFTWLHDGNWICSEHISPLKDFTMPEDFAQTATLYLGTPYLYGGRSIFGIDCSGLIQQLMISHNRPCLPRDTKEQIDTFGESRSPKDLQRNDLVYFDGHVGIMLDDRYILNATARHMNTVIEDIRDLEEIYGKIIHVARI